MSQPSRPPSPTEGARAPVVTFVVLALTLGIAQALLQPPGQVTDEGGHFGRSARVAIGDWLPRRGDVFAPGSPELVAYLYHFYSKELELRESVPRDRVPFAAYTLGEYFATPPPLAGQEHGRQALLIGTARLNPSHGYLGQAAFLTVASWLGDAPALHFYAGRLGALFAAVAVTSAAIAILPAGRWLFVFCAMTPMLLIIRSSFSSDSMTVSLSWLTVALFLRARVRSEPIRGPEIAALLAACLGMTLLKANLVLFPMIALLLPADRFPDARWRWATIAALLTIPSIATFGWWSWVSATDSTVVITPAPVAMRGVASILPLLPQFVLESPTLLAGNGWKWLGQLVGDYYGSPGYRSLTIALPDWSIALWVALLAMLVATAPRHPRIGPSAAAVAAGLGLALLLGTMFLFWLGPHLGGPIDHQIEFMGGRYLHPSLALFVPFALGLQALRGNAPASRARLATHRGVAVIGAVVLMVTSLLTNLRMNLGWPD